MLIFVNFSTKMQKCSAFSIYYDRLNMSSGYITIEMIIKQLVNQETNREINPWWNCFSLQAKTIQSKSKHRFCLHQLGFLLSWTVELEYYIESNIFTQTVTNCTFHSYSYGADCSYSPWYSTTLQFKIWYCTLDSTAVAPAQLQAYTWEGQSEQLQTISLPLHLKAERTERKIQSYQDYNLMLLVFQQFKEKLLGQCT